SGRNGPNGGLPADGGVVGGNVHTAYATYDAVENGTPLYRRALTVCGGGITEPKNLWVRTGTLYSDCEKFCGGAKEDCVKTISGGPMMGFALDNTEYSVTKTTGAILFLGAAEANTLQPTACINCARCKNACPMNLMPMYIDAYTLSGNFEAAKKYGAMSCIECGCCAYSCPAKRPIVQSVRLAKRTIKERGL
ncbi:MAG: 4Fe-4S dicluster domain-containing protein, partial [Clostridiales bacterium]|nr:4Fe-4S dicluster domain-containing protein [Clostridiales bacterium]